MFFPGDAVVNVYINHEKKFAFVEMRSVEEASNAMALDGIIFEVIVLLVLASLYILKASESPAKTECERLIC